MGELEDESDKGEREQIYRGRLLELSNFLTTFLHHYSGGDLSDGDLAFLITPSDIERALTLRYLLQCKADLLDQKDGLLVVGDRRTGLGGGGGGGNNRSTLQRIEDFLADVESELTKCSQDKAKHQRDKHINQLLERFEVWTAKDLSHTLLMPPTCRCNDQKDASTSCWTKLLHIPGAAYFVNRLPQARWSDVAASGAGGEPGLVNEGRQQEQQQQQGKSDSNPPGKPLQGKESFSKLYQQAHIQSATHALCSLILPPNQYTYEEYTRIVEMVSHLSTQAVDKAANSPVCGAVNTMQNIVPYSNTTAGATNSPGAGGTRSGNIYGTDFDFQPHDLVALWVRAQRNSAAMRHLIQIFSRLSDAEQTQLEQEWKEEHSTPIPEEIKHQVVFRGNHRSTKRRILAETKQVQDLVSWAVMNHVLFHQQYMKRQIEAQTAATKENAKKRSRTATSRGSSLPKKKSRREEQPTTTTATTPIKLEEANLQSQIDNWEKKLLQQSSFPPSAARMYYEERDLALYEQCKEAGIAEDVQERLQKIAPDLEDVASGVTLSRIDRRLKQGKYDCGLEESSKKSPFYQTLKPLLQAWREVMVESNIDVNETLLQAAIDDFDGTYENFHEVLSQEGILVAAKSLLDLDRNGLDKDLAAAEDLNEESLSRLSKLLIGMKSPWNEVCGKCGKGAKRHTNATGTFTTCANCERSFHEDCYSASDFHSLQMGEVLQGIRKDSELLSVEIPDSDLIPEWRGPNHVQQIQWTTHSLTLRRMVFEGGRFESAGMVLRMTQPSRDSLDYILSGRLTFQSLYADDFFSQYPIGFAADIEGCMVTELKENGAALKAGFMPNDVIVDLQYVSFADAAQSSCTQTIHKFANLGKEARLNLFRARATEARVTILRPNNDILSQVSKWISVIREHNNFMWNLLQDGRLLPICNACAESGQSIPNDEGEADRIKREALAARAVIRSLGRQSYSSLLHHEEYDSSEVEDCVSLARLDAMMDYIATMNSRPIPPESSELKRLENAFFVPPWISQERERLFWAPPESEKNPGDLLFRGMGILLRRPVASKHLHEGMPPHKQQNRALLRHFLDLFCSWCVPAPKLPGMRPPRSALCASSPFSEPCSICRVRRPVARNDNHVCDSKACLRMWNESAWREDDRANYLDNAALIGTTLLVFPNDPWLAHVAQREGLKIDSFGRPVEFLVTFVSPPLGDAETQFFLHPVLSENQLQFVLDRCSLLQKPPPSLSQASLEQWIEGTVLGLRGVLRVSKTDLIKKMMETTLFLERVGAYIETCAKLNRKPSPQPFPLSQDITRPTSHWVLDALLARSPLGSVSPAFINCFLQTEVEKCCQILDCMVRLPTTMMQLMLDSSYPWRIDQSPAHEAPDPWDKMEELWSVVDNYGRPSKRKKTRTANDGSSVGSDALLNLKTDNIFPNPSLRYVVLYTDLYFTSEEDKTNISRALEGQQLGMPDSFSESDPSQARTIVLCRPQKQSFSDSTLPDYQGVGWGFELGRWKHESMLRVGRVHPRSPAAAAGLKAHDVIVSMNGRSVDQRHSWSLPLICCSILASPLCVRRSRHRSEIMLNALKSSGSDGPVHGPLVIKVLRPRNPQSAPVPAAPAQFPPIQNSDAAARQSSIPARTETTKTIPQENRIVEPLSDPKSKDDPVLLPSTIQRAKPLVGNDPARVDIAPRNAEDNRGGFNQSLSSDPPGPDSASGSVTIRVHDNMRGVETRVSPAHQRFDALPDAQRTSQIFRHANNRQAEQQRQHDIRTVGAQGAQPEASDQRMLSNEQEQQRQGQTIVGHGAQPAIASRSLEQAAIAIAAVRASLPRLSHHVETTLSRRSQLKSRHLYVAVGMNTVLTKVEAAVYLESVVKEMPELGLRLLCPRYTLQTLAQNVKQFEMQGRNLVSVPRLPEQVWSKLLVKDYERWEKEPKDSPKVFKDKEHTYPLPTAKLPLDRKVEEILSEFASNAANQQQQRQQQQQQQQQQQRQHQQQQQQQPQRQHQYGGYDLEPIQVHAEPRWDGGQQQVAYGRVPPHHPYSYYNNRSHHPFAGQAQQHDPYAHDVDNPPERIRGGGGGPQTGGGKDLGPLLLSSDLASWHGQVVSFKGETETAREEAPSGDDDFLGRVQLTEDLQNGPNERITDIDEICVACFYSGSLGLFDAPRDVSVDPGDLYRVTPGSKHWDLFMRIDKKFAPLSKSSKQQPPQQHTQTNESSPLGQGHVDSEARTSQGSPVGSERNNMRADSGSSPHNTSPSRVPLSQRQTVGQQQPVSRISGSTSSLVDAARNATIEKAAFGLARKYQQPEWIVRDLGNLPDGRLVQWLPNDPRALYIQDLSGEVFADPNFRDIVSLSNRCKDPSEKICVHVDPFACCWGCTFFGAKDESSPLRLAEFQTKGLLQQHNAEFHSCGADSKQSVHLGEQASFFRVGDKATVEAITLGLTASICALSADILQKAKTTARATAFDDPSGQKIVCWPSRWKCSLSIMELVNLVKAQPESGSYNGRTKPMHQLLTLLLKIHLLFDLRHAGPSIQLSSGASQGLQAGQLARQNEALTSSQEYQSACTCALGFPSSLQKGALHCTLCALPSEAVILVESEVRGEEIVHGRHARGIGCAVPSSVLFPHTPDTTLAHRGDLGFAKMLLLRIAKNIPSQVYSTRKKGHKDPLANLCNYVWKPGFSMFVRECVSVWGLAQALVCLLPAFEAEKLPLWWRVGEYGWLQSVQRLLLSPSKSYLILHLLVLDLALSEFIETAPRDKPLKTMTFSRSQLVESKFDALSTKKRIQELLESAAANSISRYHGRHESLCSVCDNPGTLLCCDFCPRVVHKTCTEPEVVDLERWVCASCTVDITELMEIAG